MVIQILIIGPVVIIIVIIGDVIYGWIQRLLAPGCGLIRHLVLPDKCTGSCPPGSTCVATRVRPYFRGFFGVQDAACSCSLPGSGAPGGTGGPGSGSGE